MDARLQKDLERFFLVYQGNVSDILSSKLNPVMAARIKPELEEEFYLFRTSLMNRLNEEFNQR